MKFLKKLLGINLAQFIPALVIVALAVSSISSYQAPELLTAPVKQEKTVNAKTTEKKEKESVQANGGNLDLSKIADGTYEGSGNGFRGAVKVSVTVKDHKITGIEVLSFSDDSSFFTKAKSGVIPSILSAQSLNVDCVSGATYSSKGIIAAVKNALTGEVDESALAGSDSGAKGSAGKLAKVDENATYKDGTYSGSGTGWGGTTKVSVTIKNGKIASIKVLSNKDTASYFKKAKGKVISAILKKQSTNVDTVSGATYSSNGIIKAVRNALSKAKTSSSSKDKDSDSDKSSDQGVDISKITKTLSGNYKDGTYKGSAEGWGGTTTVSITVKNNQITSIKVVSNEDTPSFFTQAKAVIDKILSKQTTKVDVVSGATYSSNGIIDAVKAALSQAEDSSDSQKEDSDKKDSSEDSKEESGSTGEDSSDESESGESEKEAVVASYNTTVTVYPDEWEDFDEYNVTFTATTTDGIITDITASTSTNATNKWYVNRVISKLVPSLVALKNGSSSGVDVISGATCSSNALLEAYEKFLTLIQ